MRRRLAIAATAVAAVLVTALVVVVWSLDSIVKNALERYGSAATQVAVKVDTVSLSLLGGVFEVDRLTVANPSGFPPGDLFALDQIQVVVDRGTVLSNPAVVDALTIVAPQVHFELNRDGESNVDVIRRNLTRYGGASGSGAPAETPAPTPAVGGPKAAPRRFIIRTLSIRQAEVVVDSSAVGGERMVVTLPDTQEVDIGAPGGGATGPEVAAIVVRALVRDVGTTVAAAQIQRRIEKSLGGETGKAVGEGVGEAVKGVGRALNRLFGERGE